MQEILVRLRKKITDYHRTKWKARLFEGVGLFFLLSSATFFILTLLEVIGHGSTPVRTFYFFFWLLASVLSLAYWSLIPSFKLLRPLSESDIQQQSFEVGEQYPEIKDKLANALELSSRPEISQTGALFTNLALQDVARKTDGLIFASLVSFTKARKLLGAGLIAGVLSLLLIMSIPGLRLSAGRIILFSRSFAPPPRFYVGIVPGNSTLTRGSDLFGKVLVYGGRAKKVVLFSKLQEESEFQQKELTPDSTGEFVFQYRAMHSNMDYFARAEEVESEHYLIKVIDRPVIKELRVRLTPPGYSRLPSVEQVDNGSFTCLLGSKADFSIEASSDLSEAKIMLNDSVTIPLQVQGRHAHTEFIPRTDAGYKILVKDHDGNANESPVTYTIKLFYDAPPGIEQIVPRGDTFLDPSQRNAVTVKIADDYGFTSLQLFYRLSKSDFDKPQEKYAALQIPIDRTRNEQAVSYIWNLSELSLAAGDVISYYLEVADNNTFNGPQKARTTELTIRQPSVSEIAKQAENQQGKVEQDLAKTFREAQDLKKELESISRDMLKDKKDLSFEEKERMKNAAKKFEELKEKLSDVKKNLQDAVKDLQKNNMLSKETMEKYMELQKLMKEMDSADLQKMLERMQQNNQNQDRKQAQMDMQNMKNYEEMFQKSIERTMNLLKRVMIEQKLDQLAKQAESIQKEQQNTLEKTKNSQSGDQKERNSLEKQQKDVSRQLDQFKKDMQDLTAKMGEFKDMPNDQAKEMKQEFQEEKNEELSEEAQQDIHNEMMQSARQKQEKVNSQMQKMSKKLKSLQSSVQQQQQQKAFAEIMKLLNELLETSRMQERLKSASQQSERELSYKENAKQQQALRQDLQSIMQGMSDVSQKTFAITPEMGKELGDAQRSMDLGTQALQNRNGFAAAESQADAMKSINQAARLMKESAENMMQGGSQGGGSGMMSLMQQLNKLSGQQMQLNNMAQQLMKGANGQMSQQTMQMMERLAQQQEMIRKSLQDLTKEAASGGDTKRIANSLDPIEKQMDEVISDLRSQKVDDGLLQKQERILSRLLDAQLSVNERDFEKERESNSGKNVVGKSPRDTGKQSNTNRLRDELINSMREAYIKDYEALIRKYLEKLDSGQTK